MFDLRNQATLFRDGGTCRIAFWNWSAGVAPLDRRFQIRGPGRDAGTTGFPDCANRLLTPAFSGYQGPSYWDLYLAQGGVQYADIISDHFYVDKPQENADARMASIKSRLARNDPQAKPLWNTAQG